MATYARGFTVDDGAAATGSRAMRAHARVLARVAMAWLGSEASVSHVLEHVARELGARAWSASDDDLVVSMRALRTACATKLSSGPVRTEIPPSRRTEGDCALARVALEVLRPTERDAVVLRLVGGLRTDQVGAVCGIDETSARDRLTCGLARLLANEEGQ